MGRKPKLAKVMPSETKSEEKVINEINRSFKEVVLKFASEEKPVTRTSFGVPAIDNLTGGGLASKRFNIIWGDKGSAKTTLCYRAIAEAQKNGKRCAFIDMERTFDPEWAIKNGVNLEKLLLGNIFETAEQALDTFIHLVKAKAIDFIVVDSVQGLSPKGEQEEKGGKEKSLEKDTMALLARKLSQFFRISSASVYKGDVTVLLIGQARVGLGSFVALEELTGGKALQHWSSMTIKMRRGAKADAPITKLEIETTEGKKEKIETVIGFDCVIKLEKRKVTSMPENSEVHVPFFFENGFVKAEEKIGE